MKKLKKKVFLTIFIILSLFVIFILFISNYRNYKMQEKNIQTALNKLNISLKDVNHVHRYDNNFNEGLKVDKLFLDFTVYTVILDEKGNYMKLINHSEQSISENKIKKITKKIVNKHTKNIYIGNLYFEKYSYIFNNNTLTIVDNKGVKNKLLESIYISISLLILLEILIIIISYVLTNWIIEPVIISFNKQKEFVEDASHELKTPLSIILASCDAYSLKKEDKWVDNIKNEANKMTKLVIEMLDLAKTEQNNKEIYSKENMSKILEKCVLTFESMLFEKKIKLDYKIEDNIYINCNKEQIERLINIILDNAVNHSIENGNIKVYLKKNNKDIILEIKNKGIPIKKGEEKNIFERFYRVDEARNRDNNRYGLGLSIAKNIVDNHNGKIKCYSNNSYTTFEINFNLK